MSKSRLSQSRHLRLLALLSLILLMGISWGLAMYFTPMSGDDLAKLSVFEPDEFTMPGMDIIMYMGRHYLSCNGRLGDVLFPPLIFFLPTLIRSVITAAAIAWFLLLCVRCSHIGSPTPSGSTARDVILLSAIALTLPWWDYMTLYVCQFGYIWASMFGLWFILTYFSRWGKSASSSFFSCLCALTLGGVSGATHEAVGLPLLCGMTWFLIMNRRHHLSPRRLSLLAGLFLGTAFVLGSPGIWQRLGSMGEPNDSLGVLLLKNTWATLLLVLFMLMALVHAPWRKKLFELMRSPWAVFAVSAMASMTISGVSGIVGRPGWFSQTCALVAIWQWSSFAGLKWRRKIYAFLCGSALWIMTAIVSLTFTVWQIRFGLEATAVKSLYTSSPDGLVYYDATPDDEAPWFTLGRCRGVPDADDTYLLEMEARYNGTPKKRMVVLPTALQHTDRPDTCRLAYRTAVLTYLPDGAEIIRCDSLIVEYLLRSPSESYTVTPFSLKGKTFYLKAPLVLDPGDRL